MIKKLVDIFQAKSSYHLIKIFIVFGLAGSFSVLLSEPLLRLINLDKLISFYPLYIVIRLIIIFPLYQLTLLGIALMFGEYNYFKKFFKKFFNYFKIK